MTQRVLHVIGAMNRAGAETMLMNLYRSIDRTKVQFDFLVHTDDVCDYDAEIIQLGGHIYHVPMLMPGNYRQYRAKCRAVMQEVSAAHAVVHGHIASTSAIYLAEAKRAGCKTVMHSHAAKFPLSPRELVFRTLAYPARNIADYFIGCSPQAGLDRFGSRIAQGDRFHVLPNAIDVDMFACTDDQHRSAKRNMGYDCDVLVGTVGRLVSSKNHQFSLGVVRQLLDDGVDVRFAVAGGGELRGELEQNAVDLGLTDRVDFLGVRDDVPQLLKAFDLFLFPSVVEGLPVVMVEAQAAGLPCLTSEGIPGLAIMADTAVRLSLDLGIEAWAQKAHEMLEWQVDRSQGAQAVRDAGFAVATTAEWLTDFYLNFA